MNTRRVWVRHCAPAFPERMIFDMSEKIIYIYAKRTAESWRIRLDAGMEGVFRGYDTIAPIHQEKRHD